MPPHRLRHEASVPATAWTHVSIRFIHMRFGVIYTEDGMGWEGNEEVFARAFADAEAVDAGDEEWIVFDATKGELPTPDQLSDLTGLVLSGSHRSAWADEETVAWIKPLKVWLATHWGDASSAPPLAAICFGHQILAASLGGQAGPNPTGIERLGVETLETGEAWDAWVAAQGVEEDREETGVVRVYVAHNDCVVQPPPQAQVLATSPGAETEVFAIAHNVFSIQGHPEFDASTMDALVNAHAEADPEAHDQGKAFTQATLGVDGIEPHNAFLRKLIRSFLVSHVSS